MKLKPRKCAFGVSSRKLLGFIVSRRGIEVDPNKFMVIIDLPPPRNLKDLRSIFDKVQPIITFITHLADMTTPFSHLLNKGKNFIWDQKYQKDLDNMKIYVINPPILASYDSKRGLLLYVSTTMHSLGVMLA